MTDYELALEQLKKYPAILAEWDKSMIKRMSEVRKMPLQSGLIMKFLIDNINTIHRSMQPKELAKLAAGIAKVIPEEQLVEVIDPTFRTIEKKETLLIEALRSEAYIAEKVKTHLFTPECLVIFPALIARTPSSVYGMETIYKENKTRSIPETHYVLSAAFAKGASESVIKQVIAKTCSTAALDEALAIANNKYSPRVTAKLKKLMTDRKAAIESGNVEDAAPAPRSNAWSMFSRWVGSSKPAASSAMPAASGQAVKA